MKSRAWIRVLAVLLLLVIPLAALGETYARVTSVEPLHLRDYPGMEGDIISQYRTGTRVQILETKTATKGWVKVKAPDGNVGYMYRNYLSTFSTGGGSGSSGEIRYIKSTNGQPVNFRRRASSTSKLLDQLNVGTKVTLISSGTTWSRIKCGGKDGWVMTKYLSKTRP